MELVLLRTGFTLLLASSLRCWAGDAPSDEPARVAAAPVIVISSSASVPLDGAFEALPGSAGIDSLSEVLARQDGFVHHPQGFSRGHTDSSHWLRVTLHRRAAAPERWYLEISPPVLDEIQLYVPDADSPTGYSVQSQGDTRKFHDRPIDHQNFVFPVVLAPEQPITLYIRLKATGIMAINANLQTPERFASAALLEHRILGVYHGAWALVILANVLFWLTIRPRGFHWWVLYLFADGLQMLAANGLAFPLLAPNHPAIAELLPGLAPGLGLFSMTRFLVARFDLQQVFPELARVLLAASWLGVLGSVLIVFRPNGVVSPSLQLLGSVLLMFAQALFAHGIMRRSDKAYCVYFCAFAVLNMSFAAILGRNLGLIAPGFIVNHLWQLNLLIHVLLTNYGIYLALSRAREKQRQSETQLAAAQLYRQFVAMVSHELLTPLSTIRAALSNMSRDPGTGEQESMRRHQRLLRASQRLHMLIDNYLADGKLQAENFHLVRARIELGAWLSATLEDGGWYSQPSRVRIDPTGHSIPLSADPHLLRIAIGNLVDNALKYSPQDAPVTVRAWADSGHAFIEVRDFGPGISRDDAAKIFTPYFRSELRPAVYGVGLGLFIVYRIVELHGGTVSVASEEGRGSAFTVSLPLPREALLS